MANTQVRRTEMVPPPSRKEDGGSDLGKYHASALVEGMDALLEVVRLENELRDLDSKRTADQINAEGFIARAAAKVTKEALMKEAQLIKHQALEQYIGAGTTAASEGGAFAAYNSQSAEMERLNNERATAVNDQETWKLEGGKKTGAIGRGSTTSRDEAATREAIYTNEGTYSVEDGPKTPEQIARQQGMNLAEENEIREGLRSATEREGNVTRRMENINSTRGYTSQLARSFGSMARDTLQPAWAKAKQEADKKAQAEKEAERAVLNAAQSQVQSGEQATRQDYNKTAQNANDTIAILRDIARTNEYRA